MKFIIDEKFIDENFVVKEWGMYDNIPSNKLTPDQLLKIIRGEDRCSMSGYVEHVEFTKLRDKLEELGYIKCERFWKNGDQILKSFELNEWKFYEGQMFPCAIALKTSIECARKFGWENILSL